MAEAIKNDTASNKIHRLIELQDWNAIKNFSKYWYILRKDLSVNPNGCILYNGEMYIPTKLRKTVIDSVHKTHPGQADMIYLAQLIWYPQFHRDVVAQAQRCKQCTKTNKKILRRPMLDQQTMWNFSDSEPNLDIQYNTPENSDAESDTIPLARQRQSRQKKKQLQTEAQLTGTQQVTEQNKPGTPARASEAREERPNQDMPGTSYMESNQPLQHQAGPSNKRLNMNSQKLRTERKRKALSPSKKTTRPTKNKTSAFEQKAKEAAIAQTKLTLARKRLQQPAQKQHPLIHMDLSALSNSKTIEIKNLASNLSTPSPMRIVTSSSSNDFMTKSPKRNIDNVVDRIKASNQAREEQTTKDTDTDTDYANIIRIKKADPPKVSTQDNTTTQQNLTTPQPQYSSTPIQKEYHQHHQTAEHDSTSDIENEPQTNTTATENTQQIHDNDINTISATKTSEQNPISSLNTEDMEELNKLLFD